MEVEVVHIYIYIYLSLSLSLSFSFSVFFLIMLLPSSILKLMKIPHRYSHIHTIAYIAIETGDSYMIIGIDLPKNLHSKFS